MPPGIKYDLAAVGATPEVCNIATIYRLTGGFNLVDDKLVAGSMLPPLAPLAIDFATRKAVAVKNVKVVELAGAEATSLKIKKESLAYVGMYLGNGSVSKQVTAINKDNAAYDVITISLGAAVAAGDVLFETNAPADAVAEVKGVYTLTIGTKPAAGDKLSLDGVVYEYAAAEGDAVFATGADAKAAAANIEDAVSAQYTGKFTVKAMNGKLIFTQLVGGVGALPVLVVTPADGTGTLAATIATTTAGVAAVSGSAGSVKNVANFLNYARVKVETGATITAIGQVFEIVESKLTVPVSAKDKETLGHRFLFV